MARRAAKHVETDTAGGALGPWRQPAPGTPLLAVSVPPVEGANGRHCHAGLRSSEGPPPQLIGLFDFFEHGPPAWIPEMARRIASLRCTASAASGPIFVQKSAATDQRVGPFVKSRSFDALGPDAVYATPTLRGAQSTSGGGRAASDAS